jgi:hypothetical protein
VNLLEFLLLDLIVDTKRNGITPRTALHVFKVLQNKQRFLNRLINCYLKELLRGAQLTTHKLLTPKP